VLALLLLLCPIHIIFSAISGAKEGWQDWLYTWTEVKYTSRSNI
jgi:hypothetical protein